MLNFIIVEDCEYFLEQYKRIISEYMFKTKIKYKIYSFKEYNQDFDDISNKMLENKVYILDIETRSKNGLKVAMEIREKDLYSTLIFISAFEKEYSREILRSELQILSFISKEEDWEKDLKHKISTIIKRLKKTSLIQFEENGILYLIPENSILYITKDKGARKSRIVTDNSSVYCYRTLTSFEEDLDLVRTHRNCLVNLQRVESFDFINKVINFDNKTSIDLLSRKYNKSIKKIHK